MTLAVLVPWHQAPGSIGAHRARVWEYLRGEWAKTGVHVVAGSDPLAGHPVTRTLDGVEYLVGTSPPAIPAYAWREGLSCQTHPFSVSRALNNAARHVPDDVDMFALYGADHLPPLDTLLWAVETLERQPWTPLHRGIHYANEDSTLALLEGKIGTEHLVWRFEDALCPGVIAIRRGAWEYIGGMDEHFVQWGFEDSALVLALQTVFPIPAVPLTALFELWHPVSARDLSPSNPNRQRYEQHYLPAIGDAEQMMRVANSWRLNPSRNEEAA